ncbi:MAG: inorganic diphosphatase [Bacteroidota bacterium]
MIVFSDGQLPHFRTSVDAKSPKKGAEPGLVHFFTTFVRIHNRTGNRLLMSAHRLFVLFSCCLIGLLTACGPSDSAVDYKQLPAFTEKGFHAVIEIPAGTNHKIEYNESKAVFENDTEKGQIRIIDFLPYPGNYGFIPSTYMDPARGGDGDALDVLVIAESVPTGTVLEVKPIATLLLEDDGETDTKIIAVPVDSSLQVIDAQQFEPFMIQYNPAMTIVRDWFLNYKGMGETQFIGWRNDQYAQREIRKWEKK